jgi:hypothetical protein
MDPVGIHDNIQKAIAGNMSRGLKRCLGRQRLHTLKHRELEIVQLFERHRNAVIHWFKNGPNEILDYRNPGMDYGVSEKKAQNFSKDWRRCGTAKRHQQSRCCALSELRAQVVGSESQTAA